MSFSAWKNLQCNSVLKQWEIKSLVLNVPGHTYTKLKMGEKSFNQSHKQIRNMLSELIIGISSGTAEIRGSELGVTRKLGKRSKRELLACFGVFK